MTGGVTPLHSIVPQAAKFCNAGRDPDFATNISLEMTPAIASLIRSLGAHRRVLLTTHVRPDGDAIGTCAALALGMRQKGIEAEVLLLSPLPDKYAGLLTENGIPHHVFAQSWPTNLSLDSIDALLVADTGTWSQLPGLKERFENWDRPIYVLDHHLTQESWGTIRVVTTRAAAAAEVAAEVLSEWGVSFDQPLATALYLAIVSDTGWFQYSSTTAATLRLGALLIEAGVDIDALYQRLYQNESSTRLFIQQRAMSSLELLSNGRLAVMHLSRCDFAETGASSIDTENLINLPLQVRTVEVSIFLSDTPEGGPIRVSLRSKGQVNVSAFAEQFGGGGHARAAGLKVVSDLETARHRVVTAMLATMSE